MNISNVIKKFLKSPNNIVKIEDKANGLRLKKKSKRMRYGYTLSDILKQFESVENLLQHLKSSGYGNTSFSFERIYEKNSKITYHKIEEVKMKLEENGPQIINENMQSNFLAAAMGNPNFLGAMVQSERASDYKNKINHLEEEIKDYRSEIRRLKDENHALKLKDAIAEEKAEMMVEKALRDKKGVLESPGMQKALEGLGGAIPSLMDYLSSVKSSTVSAGLAMPQDNNLDPMQSQAFEMIQNADSDLTTLVIWVMQNDNENFREYLKKYIANGN